jgi:sRNA-binding carbon storage regulator CsrA
MPSLDNFLKQNVSGPVNKIFLASYIRDIATADNKWKAIGKTILSITAWSSHLVLPVSFVAAWVGMGRAIRAILHDTGSLDAALNRLSKIQGLQRTFTPLLGGLNAAKQRVAELAQFTARSRLFKFEEVGEASHKLEVFTRGTYSGTEALGEIQNAAVNSGNGITEVADAVGRFYANLREGAPITDASEQLREMGVISNQTADFLDNLQKSGAGTQQIFAELKASLAGAKPAGAGEDLATVQQRHAEASENLKRQFGGAFTRDDITNTKNYTDAMNAIAPAIGRVSSFASIFVNALSTVKSSIARAAAESPALRGALEGISKLLIVTTVAAGIFGAIKLPVILAGWASGITATTGLLGGLRVALIGISAVSGVLAGVAVAVYATGVFMNYRKEQERLAQETRDLAQAHLETQAAIDAQIASAQTLQQMNEALADSMAKIIDLEKQRRDILAKPLSNQTAQQLEDVDKAIAEAKSKQATAAKESLAGLTGPAKEEFITQQVQRTRELRRGAYEAAITTAAPEGRLEIMRRREADLQEEQRQAEEGLAARKDVELKRAEITDRLTEAQTKQAAAEERVGAAQDAIKQFGRSPRRDQMVREANEAHRAARKEVEGLQAEHAKAGIQAPEGTSVFAEEMARRIYLMRQSRVEVKNWNQEEAKRLETSALAGTNERQRREIMSGGTPIVAPKAQEKITALKAELATLEAPPPIKVRTEADTTRIDALKAELRSLEAPTIKASFEADVGKIHALKTELATLEAPTVKVRTEADTTKIDALKTELATLEAPTVRVRTEADTARIDALKAELLSLEAPTVKVRTEADTARIDALKAELQTLEAPTIKVRTEADTTRIDALKSELAMLEATTVKVRTEADTARIDALKAELRSLEAPTVKVRTEADTARIDALKAELVTLEAPTVKVRTEADTARIDALKAELATLEAPTVKVRTEADTARIDALKTELTTLEAPTVKVRTEADTARIDALKSELASLEAPVPIKVRTEADTARIDAIKTELATLEAPPPIQIRTEADTTKIDALKTELASLESPTVKVRTEADTARIDALKAELASLEAPPLIKIRTEADTAKIDALKAELASLESPAAIKIRTESDVARIDKLKADLAKLEGPDVTPKIQTPAAEAKIAALKSQISDLSKPVGGTGITGTGQDIFNWQYYAEQQRQKERNLPQLAEETQQQRAARMALEREQRVQTETQNLTLREHAIRRGEEGTVTPARSAIADQLADTKAFGEHFEEQISLGFSKAKATQRAIALTADELKQNTNLTGLPQIADSLTRIGGGGGVYAPDGDPRVRLQERLNKLVEDSNNYLQAIAAKEGGVE